ncbi:MAG: DNA mismatch repair endonuclease MutL [Phycisphaerales bacterium]|nr:DNA mismatch repair endonuclease MutL [Phycisphaerales bacterium]
MSTLLASQIAAGEVIERPASVVKELVENSLDAGAGRVTVELEQGGVELIRIGDDGGGIHRDDLGLAISPHATSKISAAKDLDRVGTLGFRGEALASIVSVARVGIRSRTRADVGAFEIEGEGSRIGEVRPAAGPVGTSVTVRTLFFNTPARRKFLRTIQTEQMRCMDVVRELAMGRPGTAFSVSCDGRVVLDLPAESSPRRRAIAILGKELEPELLEVHADEHDAPARREGEDRGAGGISLWGLVGRPSIARGSNKAQHVFLNGRVIRDRTIQHAIMEAYRGLIEPGRYPTAVVMIEMSPMAVDVNVHPAKAEVRFRDSSLVHSVVLAAIRRVLREADLTASGLNTGFGGLGRSLGWGGAEMERAILPGSGIAGGGSNVVGAGLAGMGGGESPTARVPPSPAAFVEYFKRFAPARPGGERLSYEAIRETIERSDAVAAAGDSAPAVSQAASASAISAEAEPVIPVVAPVNKLLQVHSSYIVTQDEQGMLIIDQHALHERAMFEYLLSRIAERELESQRLLAPVVVPASGSQVEMLASLQGLLTKIGIQAEGIGPKGIGMHSFPTFLFDRGVDPVEFMQELLEKAEAEGFAPDGEQAMRDVLDMMSCKAAVKAGDRMSGEELEHLVRLRGEVERSSKCPHGRPTSIRITVRDLERMFGRG